MTNILAYGREVKRAAVEIGGRKFVKKIGRLHRARRARAECALAPGEVAQLKFFPAVYAAEAAGLPSRWRGIFFAFPAHADDFRNAGFLHGHAVEHVADLHGLAVVRDHDKLCLAAHFRDQPCEAPHVRFIERRVHFVQNTERAGLIAEDGDEQRQRGHGFFSAAQKAKRFAGACPEAKPPHRCPHRRNYPPP